MSRILVTGATGNVGAPLLEQLAGHEVVAAVRGEETPPDAVRTVPFDFEDPATYDAALDDVSAVFLMRPPQISDVKEKMKPFVDAAVERGVDRIVFLSVLGADKNTVIPHARVEKFLVESGVDYTLLRPSFFMQNLSGTHAVDIREHDELFVPAGRGSTSFIDCRDIAAVAAKTLVEDGHAGQAYELTGNDAFDYYQVAEMFSEELGRPIEYTRPGVLRFGRRFRKRGTPYPFILVMVGLYTTVRLGLADRVTDTTETLLGRPPIDLRQFIRDYRECWER